MARLNGGKLLIDLSEISDLYFEMDDGKSISLSNEQVNAILEKGLRIKLRTSSELNARKIVIECNPLNIELAGQTLLYQGAYIDSSKQHFDVNIFLDLTNNPILIVTSAL